MDLSGRLQEEFLICQICYARYTQMERQPKLLVCSHTICAECITEYLRKRKKSKHKFPCPFCRTETNLGKDGVHGLSNNITVMGLMDLLERDPESVSIGRGGSVRSSFSPSLSKSPPKQRPSLRNIPWSAPEMGEQHQARQRYRTDSRAAGMQCDNCAEAPGTDVLSCGHVFCAHCHQKCAPGDCLQCTNTGTMRARNGSRVVTPVKPDRPPPLNPEYDEDSSPDCLRIRKPPVPKRTAPVKPLGSLSRASHSAPSLTTHGTLGGQGGTLTGRGRRSETLPSVQEHDPSNTTPGFYLSGSLAQRYAEQTEQDSGRNNDAARYPSRPHTVHISSSNTLPNRSTFGTALRSQMVLPRSATGANHHHSMQSLPTSTTSPPRTESQTMTNSERRVFSPPQPPPRFISSDGTPTSSTATPLRLLSRFGRFSATRGLETSAFQQPSCISASSASRDWAVVDAANMTLQLFSRDGSYIALFKVLGISSACFLSSDRLAVSTHRGVDIYSPDGTRLRENILSGRTEQVVTYQHGGFIAVQSRSLHFYSPALCELCVLKNRRAGKLRRATNFQQIVSVAVLGNGDVAVLDSKLGDISVIDPSGKVKLLISPAQEPCGKLLTPESIAVDRIGNIIVSDSGNRRLLRFSANGMYSRCLLNFSLGATSPPGGVTVHGVAVGEGGAMAVVVAGESMAEIRVYQLV